MWLACCLDITLSHTAISCHSIEDKNIPKDQYSNLHLSHSIMLITLLAD